MRHRVGFAAHFDSSCLECFPECRNGFTNVTQYNRVLFYNPKQRWSSRVHTVISGDELAIGTGRPPRPVREVRDCLLDEL